MDRLGERCGAIVADADRYKLYHPRYANLLAENDQTAAALVSPTPFRCTGAATSCCTPTT
jgi:hypothetical protein